MKKSPETFQQICDAIVNQGASLTRAAHAVGLNAATVFRWLGSSAEKPEDWLHTWGDFGIAPFHVHVKNANRICVALLQGEAVRMALSGFERTQVFQGKVQYTEDPVLVSDAQDPEMWKFLHGSRPITDVYARDERGAMIPLKIAEAPNPQLMGAVLKALGGEQWADKRSVAVNVTQSPGVSVMRPPIAVLPPPTNEPEDDDETPLPGSVAHLNPPPATSEARPMPYAAPVAPFGEDDPPEMISVGNDETSVSAASTVSNVRAQWAAILAKSQADTKHKRPTGHVNTGMSSDPEPTKEG